MKINVKTLKGTNFEIEAKPEDTVADVKKNIESIHGADIYPAEKQMLIYQGKVLTDTTTLAENNVAENSFIVIMLSKSKPAAAGASSASASPAPQAQAQAQAQAQPQPPSSTPSSAVPRPDTPSLLSQVQPSPAAPAPAS